MHFTDQHQKLYLGGNCGSILCSDKLYSQNHFFCMAHMKMLLPYTTREIYMQNLHPYIEEACQRRGFHFSKAISCGDRNYNVQQAKYRQACYFFRENTHFRSFTKHRVCLLFILICFLELLMILLFANILNCLQQREISIRNLFCIYIPKV